MHLIVVKSWKLLMLNFGYSKDFRSVWSAFVVRLEWAKQQRKNNSKKTKKTRRQTTRAYKSRGFPFLQKKIGDSVFFWPGVLKRKNLRNTLCDYIPLMRKKSPPRKIPRVHFRSKKWAPLGGTFWGKIFYFFVYRTFFLEKGRVHCLVAKVAPPPPRPQGDSFLSRVPLFEGGVLNKRG